MQFTHGSIEGVIIKPLKRYVDSRGWLSEIFRQDELPPELMPVMGYISVTEAGVTRGPHEHVDQTDNFAFPGPSTFRVIMWDARKDSPTYLIKTEVLAGENEPRIIIIPPGVVHAYKNVGNVAGMVLNMPNRLFAGNGKREPVDEIRHESDPHSIYLVD